MPTKLVKIEEVSEALGVPVATLRFWEQRKIGPQSARIGRRRYYREEDVNAWIDAQFAADDKVGA